MRKYVKSSIKVFSGDIFSQNGRHSHNGKKFVVMYMRKDKCEENFYRDIRQRVKETRHIFLSQKERNLVPIKSSVPIIISERIDNLIFIVLSL
jgi:hypothetical protein